MAGAATVGSMHVCPMTNPNGSPHTGGPVNPPGCTNVLIEGKFAARVGDLLTCAGPPDSIIKGSGTVLIGGQFAARVGDTTVHGGTITVGSFNVIIGD